MSLVEEFEVVCHKRSICLVYLNHLVLVNCSFVVVMVTGQYYSEDQLLNIHSFSALKRWLLSEEFTSDSSTQVASFVVKYCIRVMEQCERSEFALIQMYIHMYVPVAACLLHYIL